MIFRETEGFDLAQATGARPTFACGYGNTGTLCRPISMEYYDKQRQNVTYIVNTSVNAFRLFPLNYGRIIRPGNLKNRQAVWKW
jgi:hypothetical protein